MQLFTDNFFTDANGFYSQEGIEWTPKQVDVRWLFELNIAAKSNDPGVVSVESKNYTSLAQGNWTWEGDATFSAQTGWVSAGSPAAQVTIQTPLTPLDEDEEGHVITWNAQGQTGKDQFLNNFLYEWSNDNFHKVTF